MSLLMYSNILLFAQSDVSPTLHSIGHSAISVSDALVTAEKGETPKIG